MILVNDATELSIAL